MSKKRDILESCTNAMMILREEMGNFYQGGDDDFGYDDEFPEMEDGYPEMEGGQEMGQHNDDIRHYHSGEGQAKAQEQEENNDINLSKNDERIAQIRELALDGLQDYAEDVDSEPYQFFKKVWLMCDKAASEKDSASNGGSAG